MRSILTNARRWTLAPLLLAAVALSACGGDSSEDEAVSGKEVAAAFEKAAGGYGFEEASSLIDGAAAYAPKSNPDQQEVDQLNRALGESSLLWQVLVFGGPEPALEEEAVEDAALASNRLKQEGEGVYVGANNIAYVVNGNVVATGPVLNGDVDDETLKRWQAVVDEL